MDVINGVELIINLELIGCDGVLPKIGYDGDWLKIYYVQ